MKESKVVDSTLVRTPSVLVRLIATEKVIFTQVPPKGVADRLSMQEKSRGQVSDFFPIACVVVIALAEKDDIDQKCNRETGPFGTPDLQRSFFGEISAEPPVELAPDWCTYFEIPQARLPTAALDGRKVVHDIWGITRNQSMDMHTISSSESAIVLYIRAKLGTLRAQKLLPAPGDRQVRRHRARLVTKSNAAGPA